jgi:tRNA C32,U32 (ribose-2'-O)-methylase TrmJ
MGRDMNQIMHTPATASIEAVTASNRNETNEIDDFIMGPSAGIVFGRERSGLTNEEVFSLCSALYVIYS